MLGVGLIGSGFMGKCHALAWGSVGPVFGDVPPVRLAVLAEADAALAGSRAAALGFDRATGDWRDLVADPAVDVVSITAPNAFHAEMAIAALEAGKHVWCEKPMAPTLADAEAMLAAARRSGRVAILGYNYVQNPAIRYAAELIRAGEIGRVVHVRVEMDEDFMADPETPFYWKHAATSGYGALDDFAVHPLSLLRVLLGPVARVMAHQSRPHADRPTVEGGRRAVETFDIATVLLEMEDGASGFIAVNRAAWGRKGRIQVQVFGTLGTILFDQERMNEVQVYRAEGPAAHQGFRTVLMGPAHPPYDRFVPAPGHQIGFNDLKTIECRALLGAIAGEAAPVIDFETGLAIERTVHAAARSAAEGRWTAV